MPTDPLLDHVEKTFADAHRKEIGQEENVWRSLPFFAATLALQLAALAQVRDWVAGAAGALLVLGTILLGLAGAATLAAIVLLGLSVWPAASGMWVVSPPSATMPKGCGRKSPPTPMPARKRTSRSERCAW